MSVEEKKIEIPLLLFVAAAIIFCVCVILFVYAPNLVDIFLERGYGWRKDSTSVVFLDIGQGDATFVRFNSGETMLIDCAKDKVILPALGRVLPFWQKHIDYLVVTHPDSDHYGGCIDVLSRYNVKEIILNGYTKQDAFYKNFISTVQKENAKEHFVSTPFVWNIGSSTVQFLYPDHPIKDNFRVPGHTKDTGSNNTSIIMKISFGSQDILFIGDAEKELEEYLVEKYGSSILDVEVLKAGHHGSTSSSIEPFVSSTTPLYGIFSAGLGNSYGHPSERVLRRFERFGSSVWRTDTQGDIQAIIFDNSISIKSSK